MEGLDGNNWQSHLQQIGPAVPFHDMPSRHCHDDERLPTQMKIQIQIQIGSTVRFHDGDDDD